MDFGFVEKVLVILHGLPVLDHRVHLLVVLALCVGHRRFITTRGAFGAWRIWSPNAPHILSYMSIAFWKFNKNFLPEFGGKDKTEKQKKSGNMGFKEFPRPLRITNGGW